MTKLIQFGGEPKASTTELIQREQIAAQVVAVMRAHFSRPGPEEMKHILQCAEEQVTALELAPSPCQ